MFATRNKDPPGFITQRGRSPFTILRKGSPSSDATRARRRNGKSRGNEICRGEKKSAESSPLLSVSPSREFATKGKTRSLARPRQTSVVNFSVPPRENRTSSRKGMQAPSCLAAACRQWLYLGRKASGRRKFARSSGVFSPCLPVTETESL